MDGKNEGLTLSQRIITDTVLRMDEYKRAEWLTKRYGNGKELDKVFDKVFESFPKNDIYYFERRIRLLQEVNADSAKISDEVQNVMNLILNCPDITKLNIYQKVYQLILNGSCHFEDMPEDFKKLYPDLFLSKDAPEELKRLVYSRNLKTRTLFEHPEWIDVLVKEEINLNLLFALEDKNSTRINVEDLVNQFDSRKDAIKTILMADYFGVRVMDTTNTKGSIYQDIYQSILRGFEYSEDMPEDFKELYPNLFLSEDAPEELKRLVYSRSLYATNLQRYPEWISVLAKEEFDLNLLFKLYDKNNTQINVEDLVNQFDSREEAIKMIGIANRFGGRVVDTTNPKGSIYQGIYQSILEGSEYSEDMPEDFKELHPDLFLSEDAPKELRELVYSRRLNGWTLRGSSEWISVLVKEKINLNLLVGLHDENGIQINAEDLVNQFDSREEAFKMIIIADCFSYIGVDITNFKEDIYQRVYQSILEGSRYFEDMPKDFKELHPDLFLSEDAPEELRQFFYDNPMTFEKLKEHKDWLPFLEGKILTSLIRENPYNKYVIKFFEIFGEDKAIKLGINRAETVTEMMKAGQVDLMKSWYDKTGGKFIPDFVVMQNFRFEEADKFLTSGSKWSNLMRNQSFSKTPEARDAMLKLAYSFGVFDQDQRGFKKLQDLLTGLPKRIDAEQGYIFEQIDKQINQYSQKNASFGVESRSYFDNTTLLNLLESLKNENVGIDFSKDIFSQIYRKNDDGSYTLTINDQSCPKSAQAIRNILEEFSEIPILTPNKAHHYLGGFKLEYDSDFREFFLSNFDIIISDSRYLSQISAIQCRFKEIKTTYSNVNLTLDLAMSYINNNKYENVNTGNERVTQVAAIQNYSQQDFEILQQIYNYGKQRTFSSIPRISSVTSVNLQSGTYHYEILRLDDPRAMSIGFESDCCQRLGEPAELCMEHSMVDKNGRVFIITNTIGEVVAQSWVWRNKDVLCFDNIEVPDQKMWDSGVPRGKEDSGIRNQFTDDILSIYKMAAHELIELDEKVYRGLLKSGKITQAQYDGLRLGKITTGHGYSNIKGSLKNIPTDTETLSSPLLFEEPVKLSRGLYTSDSSGTQYVLEKREDRKEFDGETLPVHSDTYVEYNDSSFTEKDLLSLEKLEIVTKEDTRNLELSVSDYEDSEHLVTEIARNYGLNPETTRIIMNPNFAIIYDVNGDTLRVGDLLFNTHVDNEMQQMDIENQVIMQIRLALEQIATGKEIDVSTLDEKQKEMYAKVTGLTDEIDIERGVGHAR